MEAASISATNPWNSLEVVKLFADVAIPAVIALFGWRLQKAINVFESMQWKSQKLVEKRLGVYDDMAPLFNDILCYFTYVGIWKELDPSCVIKSKRELDKKIHLASPLFSKEFFDASLDFQHVCFETFNSWGVDARLRTKYERRRDAKGDAWCREWETCFSENVSEPRVVRDAYARVMKAFAQDIGVCEMSCSPVSGFATRDVR